MLRPALLLLSAALAAASEANQTSEEEAEASSGIDTDTSDDDNVTWRDVVFYIIVSLLVLVGVSTLSMLLPRMRRVVVTRGASYSDRMLAQRQLFMRLPFHRRTTVPQASGMVHMACLSSIS